MHCSHAPPKTKTCFQQTTDFPWECKAAVSSNKVNSLEVTAKQERQTAAPQLCTTTTTSTATAMATTTATTQSRAIVFLGSVNSTAATTATTTTRTTTTTTAITITTSTTATTIRHCYCCDYGCDSSYIKLRRLLLRRRLLLPPMLLLVAGMGIATGALVCCQASP